MKYLHRLLETPLKSAAKFFPVIALTGARQVGKTTLFTELLPTAQRITFDPGIDVGGARRDPELFLSNLRLPVILDEIQYAPELLSVIKRRVDEKRLPGQYWLTGSQNLSVLKSVSESLAGRVALFDLFPMTLSERYGTGTAWLPNFLQDPQTFLRSPHRRILQETSEPLFSMMWRGEFPGLIGMDDTTITLALDSYFRTYIERDVRLLSEVSDLQEFGRFTQIVANLTAQEINFSELGREIGINYKTAQRWLNILASSYQWQSLPPYFGNTIKRIAGKHKGY
jgi:predicted AAA+ superfamily ATPase